ncbi:hypothetical protein F5Y19DRAFT_294603 [Xylariaceae sp. FL1651]|nr:hypothetical protein F5Y19DRAFT_294603 [Xylariaceae sp. FL1651]
METTIMVTLISVALYGWCSLPHLATFHKCSALFHTINSLTLLPGIVLNWATMAGDAWRLF